MKAPSYIWAILRLAMGWIFLWAFADKLWGLGFATVAEKAWLSGASPTLGFLKFGTTGPLASFYQGLAGQAWVDWLYMAGLALMGISLILGIGVKIASSAGVLFMLLLYGAVFPIENNPFLDEHLVYALVLIGLAGSQSGQTLGLGKWWWNTALVKKFPILE